MSGLNIHADKSANENCYATAWSYGEICVHCGCCSPDPEVRIPSRIKYCEEMLHDERRTLEVVNRNIRYYEKELNDLMVQPIPPKHEKGEDNDKRRSD